MTTARLHRRTLRCRAAVLAEQQAGVVSRRQLRDLGLSRFDIRTQVRAGRWQQPSGRTVALTTGALPEPGRWWVALLETGDSSAALDGVTALQACGLSGYTAPITISCRPGGRARAADGADVRPTRWRYPGDVARLGIPRVRPAVAAVRAALWADTDRQAALILVMTVQQRLSTAARMIDELRRIARHRRRPLVAQLLADIDDGAQALGELDFGRLCRAHGLPKPSRQVVRSSRLGRHFLDAYFDGYELVVEIDGVHHSMGAGPLDDALRQNELVMWGTRCCEFRCWVFGCSRLRSWTSCAGACH